MNCDAKTILDESLTLDEDCMIFPLLENPKMTLWNELSQEKGMEAMSIGSVAAIQAVLSIATRPTSILGKTQIRTELN